MKNTTQKQSIYIFKSPSRIDNWLDLSIFPQTDYFVENVCNIFGLVLMEKQSSQIESHKSFVLIKQFQWRNFIHLPPLERNGFKIKYNFRKINTIGL